MGGGFINASAALSVFANSSGLSSPSLPPPLLHFSLRLSLSLSLFSFPLFSEGDKWGMGWVVVGTAVFGVPRFLAQTLENIAFFHKKVQNRGAPKTAVPTTTHPIPHLSLSYLLARVLVCCAVCHIYMMASWCSWQGEVRFFSEEAPVAEGALLTQQHVYRSSKTAYKSVRIGHPQTCVYPDVCLGIAHVSGEVPLSGQGVWQIHNVSAPFAPRNL